MASFTCHVFCVTKRLRLERFVRPPHSELAPHLATAQPLRRTLQQVWPNGLRLALAGAEPKPATRATKNSHGALPEADSAGRILRRVAPVRSRGAAGLIADTCTARARCKRCGYAMRYRSPGTRQQQCGKQGLTPELSRPAKRVRLE